MKENAPTKFLANKKRLTTNYINTEKYNDNIMISYIITGLQNGSSVSFTH